MYELEFAFSVIYSGNLRNSCQRKVNVVGRRVRSNGQFSIRRRHESGEGSTQIVHCVVVCRVCSDLLIGAILGGYPKPCIFFIFLWKKVRKKEQTSCTIL